VQKSWNKELQVRNAQDREESRTLKNTLTACQGQLRKKESEYNELLQELGRLEFDVERRANERKKAICFQRLLSKPNTAEGHMIVPTDKERHCALTSDKVCTAASTEQPIDTPETPSSTPNKENVDDVNFIPPQNETINNETHIPLSPLTPHDNTFLDLEQHEQRGQCFENNEVETNGTIVSSSTNNEHDCCYQDLLKIIEKSLLEDQVLKLTNWASEKLSIDHFESVADVLVSLNQNEVISASNLDELRDFFDSITRIDLVHRIDEFLQGNYSSVRQVYMH
jgi:hypothetical protein